MPFYGEEASGRYYENSITTSNKKPNCFFLMLLYLICRKCVVILKINSNHLSLLKKAEDKKLGHFFYNAVMKIIRNKKTISCMKLLLTIENRHKFC